MKAPVRRCNRPKGGLEHDHLPPRPQLGPGPTREFDQQFLQLEFVGIAAALKPSAHRIGRQSSDGLKLVELHDPRAKAAREFSGQRALARARRA